MGLLLGLLTEKSMFKIRSRSSSIFQKAPPAFLRRRWLSAFDSPSDHLNKSSLTGNPCNFESLSFRKLKIISPWNAMFDRTISILIKTCVSKLLINICVISQRSLFYSFLLLLPESESDCRVSLRDIAPKAYKTSWSHFLTRAHCRLSFSSYSVIPFALLCLVIPYHRGSA